MDQLEQELEGIEEIKLERQTYAIGKLITMECMFDDVHLDYLLEECMFQLQVIQRPFAQVMQQEKTIASHPSDNWQWFKSLFKLKHIRKHYLLTEHILFPRHKFPEGLGEPRVFIQHDIRNFLDNETINNNIP